MLAESKLEAIAGLRLSLVDENFVTNVTNVRVLVVTKKINQNVLSYCTVIVLLFSL